MTDSSKEARFAEFLERLAEAPAPATASEALNLIETILNQVEDERTTIPFAPENWQIDGRMYPPRADHRRQVPGEKGIVRYRSRGHNTFIQDNGAIKIQEISGKLVFAKAGADGRSIE